MRIGLYPGSFDPVTLGHVDVVGRAARLVDRLVVAVGTHHGKTPVFSPDERLAMIREECGPLAAACGAELEVVTFSGLVVEAARRHGATVMVRGLRDATDFDYEMQMVGMNGALAPEISTIFVPASPEVRHIAASLVRQIAAMGGDVRPFVPARVADALVARLSSGRPA